MNVDEALEQIDALRSLTERNNTFGGFRAIPILAGGAIAITVASLQSLPGSSSMAPPNGFVVTWTCVAMLSVTLVLADMCFRYLHRASSRRRRLTASVMARLAPCLVIGAGMTAVIQVRHPDVSWVLPSLWAMLLGLGIFATADLLPTPLRQIGFWYVAGGLGWLILAEPAAALSPTFMAVCFGGGQCLTAWRLNQLEWSPIEQRQPT